MGIIDAALAYFEERRREKEEIEREIKAEMDKRMTTLEKFGVEGVDFVTSDGTFKTSIVTPDEYSDGFTYVRDIEGRVFDNSVVYVDFGTDKYFAGGIDMVSDHITLIAKNFLGYDIEMVADDITGYKPTKKTFDSTRNSVKLWVEFLAKCVENSKGYGMVSIVNDDVLSGIRSTRFRPTIYAQEETFVDTREEDRLNKLLLDSLDDEEKAEMAEKISTLEKYGVEGVKFVDKNGTFSTKIVTPGKNGVRFEEEIMGRTVGDSVIYASWGKDSYYYDILSKPSEKVTLVAKNFNGYDVELVADDITVYDGENKYDVAGTSVELWSEFLTRCIETPRKFDFVYPEIVNDVNESLDGVLSGKIRYRVFEPVKYKKDEQQSTISSEQQLSEMFTETLSSVSMGEQLSEVMK